MQYSSFFSLKNYFFWFCLYSSFFLHCQKAGTEEDVKVYYYQGIPGCECFSHCSCFCGRSRTYCITSELPPKNILWHAFNSKLEKARAAGPYFPGETHAIIGCYRNYDCAMLSEYLNAIEIFKQRTKKEAEKSIKFFKQLYSSPNEVTKRNEAIKQIEKEVVASKVILDQIHIDIIPLYKSILTSCPHRGSYNLALTYNEGLVGFLTGDYETSLDRINEFVVFAQTLDSNEQLLNSKIYQMQGESLLEVGLYHEAILALTKSIQKDPTNKEAYFSRAASHFETGNIDLAIQDYISSESQKKLQQIEPRVSNEFSTALLSGILEGANESLVDFVPSLCSTSYGLGECLWCFVQQPHDATINFCNACYEASEAVTDYINNLDQETIEEIADEIKQLYLTFDSLGDNEKGQAIGYCVGKYGVDIFAGGAAIKCISAARNLKNANRICNFEAIVASKTSQKAMTAAAITHASKREAFFKNVRIEWDKQGKHTPGKHNYDPDKVRSILTHSDPQELLTKFAGKGISKNKMTPGMPGYVERVDFNETIGLYIDEKKPTIKLPTSKGTIKYSKKGAHIVPSNPEG